MPFEKEMAQCMQWLKVFFNTQQLAKIATILSLCALGFEIVAFIILCKRRKNRKRKEREKAQRALQFSLPDQANAFLRAKLNSSLKPPEKEVEKRDYQKEDCVQLSFAQSLLNKLFSASVSFADRLAIEETARVFQVICLREEWTEKDLKTINDGCLFILKMSAKYALDTA